MILVNQNLDSGIYEMTLEGDKELDTKSYVYTKYGTFSIVPFPPMLSVYDELEYYVVYLDKTIIGESYVTGEVDKFEQSVAYAMSTAIDIINNKLNELIEAEERAALSKITQQIIDAVNISEEHKAMYRTFLIEQGKLDDVEQEIETPTDVFGDRDA